MTGRRMTPGRRLSWTIAILVSLACWAVATALLLGWRPWG
jgi:hypothetical protein